MRDLSYSGIMMDIGLGHWGFLDFQVGLIDSNKEEYDH
jgi:hypothetical protein